MDGMDRGSSKHAPWLDDAMAKQVPPKGDAARSEEWREPEPAGEDQPEGTMVNRDSSRAGAPDGMTPDEVEQRSRLGRYIPLSCLPGTPEELRRGAESMNAPDDVLAQLDRLPAEHRFETVSQVWEALGHRNESHRS
jgi:hypothetical protein